MFQGLDAPNASFVCVAGKGFIAVEVLKWLAGNNVPTVLCSNDGEQPKERFAPYLIETARALKVEEVGLEDLYAENGLLFLSLEYDEILVPSKFNSKRLFNLHFSLLPAFKGCSTAYWPLRLGVGETGVTLHEIDSGIDTGPIIAQASTSITGSMNALELYRKLNMMGLNLVKQNFSSLWKNEYKALAQPAEGSTYFSRHLFNPNENEIPFPLTAWEVNNFVRSYFFPVFQTATFSGTPISHVEILPVRSSERPGTIVRAFSDRTEVACVDYDVHLFNYRTDN